MEKLIDQLKNAIEGKIVYWNNNRECGMVEVFDARGFVIINKDKAMKHFNTSYDGPKNIMVVPIEEVEMGIYPPIILNSKP